MLFIWLVIFLFLFIEARFHVTQDELKFAMYQGWPWTPGPPAIASQVLGLQACTTQDTNF